MGVYFSRKDSRAWVPKPYPYLGWTVNLGCPGGIAMFLLIVGAAIAVAFFVGSQF